MSWLLARSQLKRIQPYAGCRIAKMPAATTGAIECS